MKNKNKTVYFLFLIALGAVTLASCFGNSAFATTSININVSLTLYNSYSGSISLVTTGYVTGGITYISSSGITLDISASDTSTREIMGDLWSPLTGDGVGSYTDTVNHFVTAGDGPKVITGIYFKGNEFLLPQPVSVFLDTTPPTMPLGITPSLAQLIQGGNVTFNRSASSDAGAGIKEYHLIISQSPSFTSPLVFTSTATTLVVPENQLPLGTLYRYVEAVDNVGFTAASFPLFFTMSVGEGEGAIHDGAPFLRPPIDNDEDTGGGIPLPEEPIERTPLEFTRDLLQAILEAYTWPVQIGEQQQPPSIIVHQPPRVPQQEQEYTKQPKYPQIFTTPPRKPLETIAEDLKEILEGKGVKGVSRTRRHLSPEEIEKLKKLLEKSPTPIEDYIDSILPDQIDEATQEAADITADDAWEYLLEVYSQLPQTPFNEEYLQSLLSRPSQIPLVAIILWLFLICYDIETYRQWSYRLAHLHVDKPRKVVHKKVLNTGQNISPQV